jgi:hypothetical protein
MIDRLFAPVRCYGSKRYSSRHHSSRHHSSRHHSLAAGNIAAAIGISFLGSVTIMTPGAIAQAQPTPTQPTPAQPNPAQPNPAQPNPAQPNPAQPTQAQPTPSSPADASPAVPPFMQRLQTMFSPEIREVLNVCQQGQGGVDLAANQDGQVVCGDSSAKTSIAYTRYLSTLADLMAASTLLGMRVAFMSNQQIKPEMVAQLLSSPESAAPIRNALTGVFGQVGILSTKSPTSASLLADEVIKRLLPTVQSTNNLTTLLGTPEQYDLVVSQFCKAPGTSLEQVQQTVTGMTSPQIYAVCLQEAGLADELQRTLR